MIACYCNANMTKKIEIVAYFFMCHFHFLVLDSMCVFFGEVHRVLTGAVKLGCWSKQLNHDNTIFPPHLSVLPCCYETVNDTTLSSHTLVSPIGAIEWPIKHLTGYHIEGGWLEDGLLWKQGLMGVFRSSAICDLHKASEWVISVQVLRGGGARVFLAQPGSLAVWDSFLFKWICGQWSTLYLWDSGENWLLTPFKGIFKLAPNAAPNNRRSANIICAHLG